jgi:DNA-binding Lrp family transcriptional regulator
VDDIDARIVAALIRDARASYAQVGSEVGLSAPAVKRRVDRLRAAGAITGFSARVDPAAMGWTTEGYVELFCGGHTSPAEIAAAVRRYPEVVDACTVTGEAYPGRVVRGQDQERDCTFPTGRSGRCAGAVALNRIYGGRLTS